MPFDFPNSPVYGQQVTGPNNTTYTWDGTVWRVSSPIQKSPLNAGRNILHNGLFRVQQRGAGPWTGSGAATSAYTADRWILLRQGDTNSVTIIALTDTDRAQIGDESASVALQNVFTGVANTNNYSFIQQAIERVRRVSGKTVTVSFWAKASSGTPQLSATWTRYAVTFPVPSMQNKFLGTTAGTDYLSIEIYLSAAAGNPANLVNGNIGRQSGQVNFWGFQLEVGSVVTPLEKPDPRVELSTCQRFYYLSGAILFGGYAGAANGAVWSPSALPAQMRATPTIAYGTPIYSNASGLNANLVNAQTVTHQIFGTAVGGLWVSMSFTATADL
jgi:hypothetical protein